LLPVLGYALLLSACATGGTLQPFTTDGCSVFPNGLPNHKNLWLKCCIEHDRAYWLGGTYTERKAADKALRACVSQTNEPGIAKIMLRGVRVGGSPYLPTPFRWGYGWPYGRGYNSVTPNERSEAEKLRDAERAPGQILGQ
jgi:hypothetical protein